MRLIKRPFSAIAARAASRYTESLLGRAKKLLRANLAQSDTHALDSCPWPAALPKGGEAERGSSIAMKRKRIERFSSWKRLRMAMLHKLKVEYRQMLRIPLGVALFKPPGTSAELISELVQLVGPPLLITVGDFVTANLRRIGLEPQIAVIDRRTMREKVAPDLSLIEERERLLCSNPPGTLSDEAVEAVKTSIIRAASGARAVIIVDGEEDLLALPALALAPKRSLVVYGLWLGAAVAAICHPSVGKGVARILREAFDPPLSLS